MDIVMKIFWEIDMKNDSGNNVISLLFSANSRFHCGKNNLWKYWNDELKSKIVTNNKIQIIDKDIIDQLNNHLKTMLYLW